MADPTFTLAAQRIITASARLEVELDKRDPSGIAIEVLRMLRHNAAIAMVALVNVNAYAEHGMRDVAHCQGEVRRYDDWVKWLQAILNQGQILDSELRDEDREELLSILTSSDQGTKEAIALGLIDDQSTTAD